MRGWILGLGLAVASPAWAARSVAVLPLEAGAGAEAHAGLGRALAGMLVADLSKSAALQLVERDRLDAVLAEIELGKSGFLDPATARQAGKGVGAEVVVLGSWSVVEGRFLMDARFVEVESGKVVQAAAADGAAADFVSVEKEVVEELLAGLAVEVSSAERRKILGDAPTEDFTAFTAYGAGLDAQVRGDVEAARQAFSTAVTVDPAFTEAQAALESLRLLAETARASDAAKARSAWEQQLDAILAATVDERTRPANFRDDLEAASGFALRMAALEAAGRPCQRAEELHHFLSRHKWRWSTPSGPGKAPTLETAARLAKAAGAMPANEDPYRPDSRGGHLVWSGTFLLRDAGTLSFGNGDPRPWETGLPGLVNDLVRCYAPPEAARRADAMRAEVLASGAGSDILDQGTYPGITLADRWTVAAGLLDVAANGMNVRWQREMEAMLARFPNDGPPDYSRRWVLHRTETLTATARLHDRREALRMGLTQAQLVAAVNGVYGHGDRALDTSTPYCAWIVGQALANAKRSPQPPLPAELDADQLSRHVHALTALVDTGCLTGVPARAKTPEEVFGLVRSAPSRRRVGFSEREEASCEGALAQIDTYTDPARLAGATPDIQHLYTQHALIYYYGQLVFPGCVRR